MASVTKLIASIVAGSLIAGCAVTKHQLTDPNVAARFDSSKSPKDFAACAASALGADFDLQQLGPAYALIRKDGLVVKTRWDFFQTTTGSQAELRNGSTGDGGAEAVRGCAG